MANMGGKSAVWFLSMLCVLCLMPSRAAANKLGAGLSVWSDSDGTDVVTPRVRSQIALVEDETTLDVAYAADIWTSASIDIRTAATQRVTEQRDELNFGVNHELDDITLGAGFRYSSEPDYLSHTGSLSAAFDFADGSASLNSRISLAYDKVGRSGDPTFDRALTTGAAQVALTQVLTKHAIMQAVYEGIQAHGYQSSPYRFVGIGGNGLCGGTASFCLREAHPDLRTRHAFVFRVAQTLGRRFSGAASYRFYMDDWGLLGHTALGDVTWLVANTTSLALRYRYHTQGAVEFYRSLYPELPSAEEPYITRDRELSEMTAHRVALTYEKEFDLLDSGPVVHATLSGGGVFFNYAEFIGLDTVRALELTMAAVLEL